jgi:UDP-N-acetylmuramyl-tripeptide synthetase
MVGVTGTNGKTSVSQWIASACEALGRRSAVIGTLGNGLVGERVEAKNTTPDPIVLQRLLADYLRRGARVAAMEVSSHGLDQGRVAGIKYDVAVFTNLTRDHLDYHRTMEAYAEAKFRLFAARGLKRAVVNVDDDWGAKLASLLEARGLDTITYGTKGGARLEASRIGLSEEGVRFHVASEWGEGEIRAPMLGAFNVSNLLAVIGALVAAGFTSTRSRARSRSSSPVPGRLERLGGGKRPLVVIDYAHTPDALEKALEACGRSSPRIAGSSASFGCGGDRDAGKRPIMGATAARLADHVIVTSDNPRSEDPAKIISQVLDGIPAARPRRSRIARSRSSPPSTTPRRATCCSSPARATRPTRKWPARACPSATARSHAPRWTNGKAINEWRLHPAPDHDEPRRRRDRDLRRAARIPRGDLRRHDRQPASLRGRPLRGARGRALRRTRVRRRRDAPRRGRAPRSRAACRRTCRFRRSSSATRASASGGSPRAGAGASPCRSSRSPAATARRR